MPAATPAAKASLVLVGGLLGVAALSALISNRNGHNNGKAHSSHSGNHHSEGNKSGHRGDGDGDGDGGAEGAGGGVPLASHHRRRRRRRRRHHRRAKSTLPRPISIAKLRERLEFLDQLSFGATGKVIRARYRDIAAASTEIMHQQRSRGSQQMCALKIVNKSQFRGRFGDPALKLLRAEVKILRSVQHPHIIRLYDVFQTDNNVFFSMELACGGDLFSFIKDGLHRPHVHDPDHSDQQHRYIRSVVERQARGIVGQVTEALMYLHNTVGVIHRDVKPENILVSTDWRKRAFWRAAPVPPPSQREVDVVDVKLCDFGLSAFFANPHHHRVGNAAGPGSQNGGGSSSGAPRPETEEWGGPGINMDTCKRAPSLHNVEQWSSGSDGGDCISAVLGVANRQRDDTSQSVQPLHRKARVGPQTTKPFSETLMRTQQWLPAESMSQCPLVPPEVESSAVRVLGEVGVHSVTGPLLRIVRPMYESDAKNVAKRRLAPRFIRPLR